VINGTKNWITNPASPTSTSSSPSPTARRPLARDHGVRGRGRPAGLQRRQARAQARDPGSPTGQPIFDDVRVPAENVIGEVGRGLQGRAGDARALAPRRAAQAVGIAQGATDYAVAYAKERRSSEQPINSFQAIQFKLADMETQCAAGARAALPGVLARSIAAARRSRQVLSMAKLFCSDNAMRVTVEAVQVLGGYGYVKEYPVERMMRDAKITQIYEGTNEIQRVVIAERSGVSAA
jgi:alkylation response protein AidB-like acyl-CoA dehydrogenase